MCRDHRYGRGIGAATAKAFGEAGAMVLVVDQPEEHGREVILPAKSGAIINSLRGVAGKCAYIASKHGILF